MHADRRRYLLKEWTYKVLAFVACAAFFAGAVFVVLGVWGVLPGMLGVKLVETCWITSFVSGIGMVATA